MKMSRRPSSSPASCPAAKLTKTNVTYAEIQRASNKCLTALLVCQNCKQVPTSFSISEKDFWLMTLHCGKCNLSFNVCTLCRNNKYQLHNDTDIRRHQWLVSHKNNVSKYNIELEERHKVVEENDQFILDSSSILEPEQQRLSQHLSIPTMKYYLMENYSLGDPYLYASSFPPYHGNIYDQVTTYDADFSLHFGLRTFCLIVLMILQERHL